MVRLPAALVGGLLAVCSSPGFSPLPAAGADWDIAFRGGYGWTVGNREPTENAPYLNVVGARSINPHLSLVGSAGYLPFPTRRSATACFFDPYVGPCPAVTLRADIVPVALGFRFGGPGPGGAYRPSLEFAPTVFYGRWVRESTVAGVPGSDSTSMDRVFLGFQAALAVPFRITDRWYAEIGFLYLHSESLDARSEFGSMEGLRQMHVLGSLGHRFGTP